MELLKITFAILGILALAIVAFVLLVRAAGGILGGGKSVLLVLIILIFTSTASAQEHTKYYVTESSAWTAWETEDFSQLKEGTEVKLVLPADTVERLRQGNLTEADKESIAASLVTALWIVIPVRTCTLKESEGETDRVINTPAGICRRL